MQLLRVDFNNWAGGEKGEEGALDNHSTNRTLQLQPSSHPVAAKADQSCTGEGALEKPTAHVQALTALPAPENSSLTFQLESFVGGCRLDFFFFWSLLFSSYTGIR